MHPALAALYGTIASGDPHLDKTASEEEGPIHIDDLDLDQVSANDLLDAIDGGYVVTDDVEKTAGGEEIDLSDLSGTELMELLEAVEAEKTAAEEGEIDLSDLSGSELMELLQAVEGEEQIEKMAADGSLEYFDTAGRVMAHAYFDEMNKVAAASEELGDEIEVDLDEIRGDQLLELMEAGYEFDYGGEKVASKANAGQAAKNLMQVADEGMQGLGRRVAKPFQRRNAKIDKLTEKGFKRDAVEQAALQQLKAKGPQGLTDAQARALGIGVTGAGAAAVGGTGIAGTAALMKRRKNKRQS